MNVCSLPFLSLCLVLVLVVSTMPGRAPRRICLVAANLIFLGLTLQDWRNVAAMALWVLGTYALLRLVRGRSARWRVPTIAAGTIAAFLYLKRYAFLTAVLPEEAWITGFEVLGISYMLFKFIHMLVDQSQDQLAPYGLASYANYQLSFYTLLAGPIQRYNDFQSFWDAETPDLPDARGSLECWDRLLSGMFKVGLFAPLALQVYDDSSFRFFSGSETDIPGRFALMFYAYPIYMYLNFSGYTDIVVAAARLIGLILPENFDRPYLARNPIDYWNRWHISLTHWIRDYVFMASYKKAVEHYPRRAKPLGYGLLFVSLLLSGVWHGSTGSYAIFGAIHGAGVAGNQAYADWLRKRLGRERFKAYQESRGIRRVARVLTFHFVCIAFMVFAMGASKTIASFRMLGRWGISAIGADGLAGLGAASVAGLAALAILLLALWKADSILERMTLLRARLFAGNRSQYGLVVAKTMAMAVTLVLLWGLEKEPEISYMRF